MAHLILNGRKASLDENLFASFHGSSVFTTLRSKNRVLCYWAQHWQRLCRHARFFSYSIPKENHVRNQIQSALVKSNHDQKIRIIINQQFYAITIEDMVPIDQSIYQGVEVIISRYQVHPQLAHLKTANYLPYTLALKEAQSKGVFEALLSNQEGFVVDGSRCGLLLFKQEQFFSLEGGLESIMREAAINFIKDSKKFSVHKKYFNQEELDGQLLLCNSLLGIVPVGAPIHPFIIKLIDYFRY
ncbi:MAG: aminotransferase class IV [Myxococcales bacterium]|nr:aminotransferase class IV [Myxococcales bacterium]USN50973.1 MAG: aminotransferase class IV [Myxococcales bacterium]